MPVSKEKQVGIYRILNTITGQSYVGSSTDLEMRRARHFSLLKHGKSHAFKLQKAYYKYGAKSFLFEILEECKQPELQEHEIAWLDAFDCVQSGYNYSREVMHPGRGRDSLLENEVNEIRKEQARGMFDIKKYPTDWPLVRARILERDRHRCVECGVKNFSVGERQENGNFLLWRETESSIEAYAVAEEASDQTGRKQIVIILACSHLENPDPLDCREENLAMKCDYHHLKSDRYQHAKNARVTWQKKKRVIQSEKRRTIDDAAYAIF